MKSTNLIIAFILFFASGCSQLADLNVNIVYDEPYEINVKTISKTIDSQYFVKFDSVLNDSRCPQGAVCVWEGYAKVRFIISDSIKGGQSQPIELFTLQQNEMSNEAFYKNIKIKLIELTPYPSIKSEPKYGKYRAKIIISKTN